MVDSVTGEPVRGVSLNLLGLPPGTARRSEITDANGRFAFADVEPGSYGLLSSQPLGDSRQILTLSPGQVLTDVEIRLPSSGTISGRVVNGEGRPVPKAMVMRLGAEGTGGGLTADSDGEFRFPRLPPGRYTLLAIPGDSEPAAGTEERYLPTSYPSAADETSAVPLVVSSGQEVSGVTIVLRKGRLYRVQGSVVTASPGLSPSDVRVVLASRSRSSLAGSLLNRERGGSGGVTASPDGAFDLGQAPPGAYYVRAERKDDSRVVLGRTKVDIISEDVKGLLLIAKESLVVRGSMRMEGGLELDPARVAVQLVPLEGPQPAWAASTLSVEDTFLMDEIPADEYDFLVSGLPEGAYVKSIKLGGREINGSRMDLSGLETVPPLEVLVSPNGATVEGMVEDDEKPTAGAWVCLVPDPPRPELRRRTASGRAGIKGRFRLPGITPGDYRLYAFEGPPPNSLVDLGFFKPFESQSVRVAVQEGERRWVEVPLLRLAEAR